MAIARNDKIVAAALALLLSTAGTALGNPGNSDTSVTGAIAATSAPSSDADLNSRIPLPDPLDVRDTLREAIEGGGE